MAKRPFHNSQDEASGDSSEEASSTDTPRLFLKKAPSGGETSQDVFDEMVPEFMHRDFYRSREDEFPAIDPNFHRRSGELEKAVPLTPLRDSQEKKKIVPPPAVSEEPPAASVEPLQAPKALRSAPLRSSTSKESETVSLDKDEAPIPPLRTGATPLPRPVKTSGLNLPLVACLLFIVGLFLWREQTRPEVKETIALPVPNVVKVSTETFEATALEGESPYPEMDPVPGAAEARDTEPSADPSDVEDLESQFTQIEEAEPIPEENPASADAVQRAAILRRMNEGNVSRNERVRRLEDGGASAESTSDGSLFPEAETVESVPAETAVEQTPEDAAVLPPDDSLFPVEAAPDKAAPAISAPPPVEPPPVQVPVTQGEPYQIAEPDL